MYGVCVRSEPANHSNCLVGVFKTVKATDFKFDKGSVQIWSLKFFWKGGGAWPWSRDHQHFWTTWHRYALSL